MTSPDLFVLANVLLALFVMVFAWYSVHHVWKNKKRRATWLLMLAIGILLFVTQAMTLLSLTGLYHWAHLRPYLDLMFLVLLLFTVIFQYQLILESQRRHGKHKK